MSVDELVVAMVVPLGRLQAAASVVLMAEQLVVHSVFWKAVPWVEMLVYQQVEKLAAVTVGQLVDS